MAPQLNSSLSLSIVLLMILSMYSLASAQLEEGKGIATSTRDLSNPRCESLIIGDKMVAGVLSSLFSEAICGQHYEVSCIGAADAHSPNPCIGTQPVNVTITDSCEGGDCGIFNLYEGAFAKIANIEAGRISISYKRVITS